jgi:hypothetical protein
VTRSALELALGHAASPAERFALFGALLAKATRLGTKLVIVGGSAIAIYTHGAYVSGDVDIVGGKVRILPVLKRWGFEGVSDPDGRAYWKRDDLGLFVDVLSRTEYFGHHAEVRTIETAEGPVSLSAVEDLIVRRLEFWMRTGRQELLDQAVLLFLDHEDSLDRAYLRSEIAYERGALAYQELVRRAALVADRSR